MRTNKYPKKLPEHKFQRAKLLVETYRKTGIAYSDITKPYDLSSIFFCWELLRQEEIIRRVEGNFDRACACSLMADHIEYYGTMPEYLNGFEKNGIPCALKY